MKGHVSKRGKTWAYWFDIDPAPLTGKRQQQTKSGFNSEREAWKQCRAAIAGYEKGRVVNSSRRKVGHALEEWLSRIEHSIKPSMARNWRNYEILKNGPDVASFKVDYAPWPVDVERKVWESRTFTLPLGTNFTRMVSTRRPISGSR